MIQPLQDYVLIERLPEPERVGKIYVPQIAQEKGLEGVVLAVGPGKRMPDGSRKPLELRPGMRVLFNSKWNDFSADHYSTEGGTEARHRAERERLHLVQEADVFLKLDA